MSASLLAVEPTYRSVPKYHRTFGPEVADLNELVGFAPDPEQRLLLDTVFGADERGLSVAFETAVIACRQNLKTGLFKQATLGWLFITDERLVVWSAHEWDTVKEAFQDLEQLITGSDVLRRRVKHIYRGNGDEAIKLTTGARLIFKTRTKAGGRGLSGRKVILDEGFALQPAHMGALLPTLSAQPDPQVLYGSSAGLPESAVLRGIRDRGRAGKDRRLAYFEWCSPLPAEVCELGESCSHALDAVGCGCDDPANWQYGNPAMGRRISVDYIAAERRAMPPEEFGRERMGWWDDPLDGVSPISLTEWAQRADLRSQVKDPIALAFDVTPDRSMSSIGAAGRRADGLGHAEVIAHGPGTGWMVDRLVSLAEKWRPCVLVLDPAGPAGAFEKELNERGFKTTPGPDERQLHLTTAREYAQACGALVDDTTNNRWRHLNQAPLNAAVEGVRTRPLADAYAWSRKDSSVDISPLVAVTLARHGFAAYGVEEAPAPFVLVGD